MSKIALVIPTLGHGGAERIMSELANEWAGKGHDVHLILLVDRPKFYSIDNNVVIYNVGFNSGRGFKKVLSELSVLRDLRNLIIKLEPDFVLSFMVKYNIVSLIATSFTNIPTFVSDRSNPKKSIPFYLRMLSKITYRKAAGIICQTELAKKIMLANVPNANIRVIPNPIRKINIDETIQKENIILNIGRLIATKGHEDLLSAFSKLAHPTWKLVILGDGPLKDHLQDTADVLGIGDRVFLLGVVRNVDEWLSKASIFAFPSYSEGFPNALVEAMAAGLPCVSFDCDAGPANLIEHGKNGYLVDVGDINGLERQLNTLIIDSNLRVKVGKEAALLSDSLDKARIADLFLDFCLS